MPSSGSGTSSRISTRASPMYWRTRSRVWRALSFTTASTPWPPPNKPCYLRMSRTSLETSLPSGENRIFQHLPAGNRNQWAAVGSIPLPPVRGAHPAQFAGVAEKAVLDHVTWKAVNRLICGKRTAAGQPANHSHRIYPLMRGDTGDESTRRRLEYSSKTKYEGTIPYVIVWPYIRE